MISNYYEKKHYLIKHQRGECAIAHDLCKKGTQTLTHGQPELHHQLHNTKINRKRFPNYINSLWNLVVVCHDLHMENPSFGNISLLEADKREDFLIQHPMINKFMNEVI